MKKHIAFVLGAATAAMLATAAALRAADTVKVFLLAGQSNMEGKAPNTLLDDQAEAPETKQFFQHLRKDGKWIVRDDVFIKFLDRQGPLTVGYGSPGRTGAELEFGTMMGDHFAEPVLLIKTAWGGRSLVKDFRPPSAGLPSDEALQQELAQARQRTTQHNETRKKNDPLPTMDDIQKAYGATYREMLAEIKSTLDHHGTLFPKLKGKQPELAGFVWFQGWNDLFGGAEQEYAANMKHFIHDVRKDLKAPDLPFVIVAMGQNGSQPATGAMLTVREAQMAMNDVPEFQGNVKAFRSDVLVDKAAEALYPHWKKDLEQWKKVGGDFGYHYLGSAVWFTRIGHAMGEAMLELMKKPPGRDPAGDASFLHHRRSAQHLARRRAGMRRAGMMPLNTARHASACNTWCMPFSNSSTRSAPRRLRSPTRPGLHAPRTAPAAGG